MYNKLLLLSAGILLCCACQKVTPPAPILPVPTQNQINWQKMETYAFVHFGLNTFNDLEWGFGNTPASTFNPTDLDCEQWVRIIKAAGLKGVMLTAKHHDGFCLWPSQYTEYSVKNSPWKGGKGDMVKELSDACKKHGLKFGIYLSPWDRNHAEYGRPEYVTYFHNQMKELLSNYGELFEYWFDGANGGDGWYGGANERRSIDARTYYRYEDARKTINELQPHAVIFGGTCADIRWIGNEEGWAGETNWCMFNDTQKGKATEGMQDAGKWEPGECDVSIRPGWFYHAREDHQVRSLSRLVDLYYRSVGHNANFLLNFPVALNGKIHPTDSARAVEWRKTIDAELQTNLLKNAKATADNHRGNASRFAPAKAIDGNWDTYWATDDSVTQGSITLTFPQTQALNRLLIQEYIPLGQRVIAFHVEYQNDRKWLPLEIAEKTTTIGYKRILRFNTIETKQLRISFDQSRGPLCINNIEAFLAPVLLEEPQIARNGNNEIILKAGDPESVIYYTTDGTEPSSRSNLYDPAQPFVWAQKGVIKAISYDAQTGKQSPVAVKHLDIPTASFSVKNAPKTAGDKIKRMFDGNGYTAFYLPAEAKQEITINLGGTHTLNGFTYTPDQNRWGGGIISHFEFYVGNRLVASGEFSNIKNNPIEQTVTFEPTRGNTVRFVAQKIINGKNMGIGEFTVLTSDK
ncbi:alpha-L-fucosidase [Odoribacter lunatus]|uniref:alpha-L-fucosidase n=1 Tax=Odoribacter lunatus TaxID=2941335 RepID=UPI0020418ACA|nr:alpha-L-fucosidase [Odoribacter lunatus]